MKLSYYIILVCCLTTISCAPKENKVGTTNHLQEESHKQTQEPVLNPKATQQKLNLITGHFDPSVHPDFVKIDSQYADQADRLMQKRAYASFVKMFAAAKEAGIVLQIKSATRNFDYQKGIWERKWTGKTKLSDGTDVSKDIKEPKSKALKILEYSSMPGTSRHHWGTDIDLNSFDNAWFGEGEGLKIYQWMVAHAHEYGFCQPYTEKGSQRPNGYNEEKWHWSYTPIADEYTLLASKYLQDTMITGFQGAETAAQIGVVNKYILGINHSCSNH